jgi:hypothetical protein
MYIVYGERYKDISPILDKNGVVICDGKPKKIKLSSWESEDIAKEFAANVKNSVPKRSWDISIEST